MIDLGEALRQTNGDRLLWSSDVIQHKNAGSSTLKRVSEILGKYATDQQRDDHGRFANEGRASEPDDPHDSVAFDEPGEGSTVDAAQATEVKDAVDHVMSKYPEIAKGPNGLRAVTFATASDPPPGLTSEQWEKMAELPESDGALAETFTPTVEQKLDRGLSGIPGQYIVYNDGHAFDPADTGAPSTQTLPGVITHEMGHAYFSEHGVENDEAINLLDNAGLGPYEVQRLSDYAASGPHEALAEMFGMENTPGFKLPDWLEGSYQRLIDGVTPTYQEAAGKGTYPKAGSALEAAAQRATEKNIAAGAWVTSLAQEMTAPEPPPGTPPSHA